MLQHLALRHSNGIKTTHESMGAQGGSPSPLPRGDAAGCYMRETEDGSSWLIALQGGKVDDAAVGDLWLASVSAERITWNCCSDDVGGQICVRYGHKLLAWDAYTLLSLPPTSLPHRCPTLEQSMVGFHLQAEGESLEILKNVFHDMTCKFMRIGPYCRFSYR